MKKTISLQLINLFLLLSLVNYGCNSPNACSSCWEITGWQQPGNGYGNTPILNAADCNLVFDNGVWVDTYNSTTGARYSFNLDKSDPYISQNANNFLFQPLLYIVQDTIGQNPPIVRTDGLACAGCPNKQDAFVRCPCPNNFTGCKANDKPGELDPG